MGTTDVDSCALRFSRESRPRRQRMRTLRSAMAMAGAFFALVAAQLSEARVVRFAVQQKTPYLGGAAGGNAGPYELLQGTAYFTVDPHDRRDAVIVDLGSAPRDAQGLVEFSTPFFVLTPAD